MTGGGFRGPNAIELGDRPPVPYHHLPSYNHCTDPGNNGRQTNSGVEVSDGMDRGLRGQSFFTLLSIIPAKLNYFPPPGGHEYGDLKPMSTPSLTFIPE